MWFVNFVNWAVEKSGISATLGAILVLIGFALGATFVRLTGQDERLNSYVASNAVLTTTLTLGMERFVVTEEEARAAITKLAVIVGDVERLQRDYAALQEAFEGYREETDDLLDNLEDQVEDLVRIP